VGLLFVSGLFMALSGYYCFGPEIRAIGGDAYNFISKRYIQRTHAGFAEYFMGGDQGLLINAPVGDFIGATGDNDMRYWTGIRYANIPERFSASVPADPHESPYKANIVAPSCIQTHNTDNARPILQSEDCLYLTITAPKYQSVKFSSEQPVLVYLHGGPHKFGGDTPPPFDSTTFAQKNIITVQMNYRQGVFGFMSTDKLHGNYGFQDQKLALLWVQKNIGAFGGDPTRITLMGHSDGAMAVAAHLASPGSHGLFRAVIIQSGMFGVPFEDKQKSKTLATQIFKSVGCHITDLQCIRDAPYTDIVKAQQALPQALVQFTPMVEAQGMIPVQPFVAISQGLIPDVPILAGFVRDEAAHLTQSLHPNALDQHDYNSFLSIFGTSAVSDLSYLYSYTFDTDARLPVSDLISDVTVNCPTLAMLSKASLSRSSPIYVYEFAHVPKTASHLHADDGFYNNLVYHHSDMFFMFDILHNNNNNNNNNLTPVTEEKELGENMSRAWTNFITSYDPNKGQSLSTASFPTLKEENKLLEMDVALKSVQSIYARQSHCSLWAKSGIYPGSSCHNLTVNSLPF